MTPEWVQKRTEEYRNKSNMYPERLVDIWEGIPEGYHYLISPRIELIIRIIKLSLKCNEPIWTQDILQLQTALEHNRNMSHYNFDKDKEFFEQKCHLSKDQMDRMLNRLIEATSECLYYMTHENPYPMLLDSPVLKMRGDIIVTDPRYIFLDVDLPTEETLAKHNMFGLLRIVEDQEHVHKHYNLEKKVVNYEFAIPKQSICVVRLEDVLRINPEFDYHVTKPHLCTCIKNFKGTAQIKVGLKCYHTNERTMQVYEGQVRLIGTQGDDTQSMTLVL